MKIKLIILVLISFVISCITTHEIIPKLTYTTTGMDFDSLEVKYDSVQINRSTQFEHFIVRLNKIKNRPKINQINKYGPIDAQIFITKMGQLESVFILNPSHPFLDSLVTSALKASHFKQLKSKSGQPIKYSVLVTYLITGEAFIYPYVNGKLVNPNPSKQVSALTSDLERGTTQVPPYITYKPLPKYPDIARKIGLEGKVVVTISIDKKGRVTAAKVFKSDSDLFNASSIDAAFRCKFKPAIANSKYVSSKINVPFYFRLR